MMGHPYRERHTQPDSTTTENLSGLTGGQAQQVKKQSTKAAQSKPKRSSK